MYMMWRKKLRIASFISSKLTLLTISIALSLYQECFGLTVKIGTLAPADSDWMKIINDIIIDTIKNSDVKFVFYTGGTMGDEDEMIRKIRIGQLHGGGFTTVGIKKTAPELGILDLPMILRNYKELDMIMDKFLPEFEKIYEKRGFKLLLLTEQGFSYFFTTRKDVNGLKDLGKTRLWGWKEERVIQNVAKIFGTSPIFVLVPDVLAGLDTGMVETFDVSPMGCIALQWCKVAKAVIDLPYRFEAGAVIINLKTWESIPENVRGELERKFKENRKIINQKIREGNESALKKIKDMGLKFVKPSQSEIDWFENQVKDKIWFSKDSEYPHELLKKLLDELEKIRKGS
jgi:TRAP-type C4-dicarboxylate transport system substrate-binding protein